MRLRWPSTDAPRYSGVRTRSSRATAIVADYLQPPLRRSVQCAVRVYSQAAEAAVHHLRTRRGTHEVDLIVERADGRVVALEVKLGRNVTDDDVRHLIWLSREMDDDLLDTAVITTGPDAYRRPDGIAIIPAALLGP